MQEQPDNDGQGHIISRYPIIQSQAFTNSTCHTPMTYGFVTTGFPHKLFSTRQGHLQQQQKQIRVYLGSKSMGSSIRGPTEAPSRRAHIALYTVSELTHILDDRNILNTPVIINF